jgi:hypothetical protein
VQRQIASMTRSIDEIVWGQDEQILGQKYHERECHWVNPEIAPDFSVVSFRPGFMRVSEGCSMKSHINQCLQRLSYELKVPYRVLPGFQIRLNEGQNP